MSRSEKTDGASSPWEHGTVVRVGLLYSTTGYAAAEETSIRQGAILAAEQINDQSDSLGFQLELVLSDYQSDSTQAGRNAVDMLSRDRVDVLVGGYTSASRVAIVAATEHLDCAYIYPTYFEGLEIQPNVLYTGAVPNQYFETYLQWIFENLGKKVYVIGSDYVYPRTLSVMIQTLAREAGAQIVADRYVPLGTTELEHIVREICELQPAVVISNLVGVDSLRSLYHEFHRAGLDSAILPIAATVTTEFEVSEIGPEYVQGHYMVSTYFGSLENAPNQSYVAALKHRFGDATVPHVAQVGAYNAIWVLAEALRQCAVLTPAAIRTALKKASFGGNPEGWPLVMRDNHHSTHGSYIGVAETDGSYTVVMTIPPCDPDPYPPSIVPAEKRPLTT